MKMENKKRKYKGYDDPDVLKRLRIENVCNDLAFPSKDLAEAIVEKLKENINEYGFATVSDLYDLTGIVGDPIYNYFGWTEIGGVEIDEYRDGWTIDFPPICKINAKSAEKTDMVNHPPHYKSETDLEVIDAIEAFTFDLKGIEAVDTANAIKYICRWSKKNGVEDLKKAVWYINHLIKHLEKLEEENK